MDSLTQFVLGAAVSTACLGTRIGPRKAALIGGALGTLPDLDVFLPFADPVDSFVYHRGWTHSIFVHTLAAPVIGEGLVRLFKGLRDHRWLTWAAVYLCLATHAIIDAMTVYGTRIFWPFYTDPVGVGSVFIIDPIYSLPLIAIVIWALFRKTPSLRLSRATNAVLLLTSGYLALSIGLQAHIENRAQRILQAAGITPDRTYAIAAPFNTVVWKVIALEGDRYHNLYLSFLDGDESPLIYTHPRNPELVSCLGETPAYRKLDWFSRGYNRADLKGDKVVVSDLRMGLTPGYVFQFAIADVSENGIKPIPPERDLSERRIDSEDWTWLQARFFGEPLVRAAERGAADGTQFAQSASTRSC
jgi:inner membrane protein